MSGEQQEYERDGIKYTISVTAQSEGFDADWQCSSGHTGKVLALPTEDEAVKAAIQNLQGHHFFEHSKTRSERP